MLGWDVVGIVVVVGDVVEGLVVGDCVYYVGVINCFGFNVEL